MAPDSDAARSSEINTENPTAEELVARARALIGKGEHVPDDPRMSLTMAASYASLLACKSIERIFYAGGAGGLSLEQEIQRIFRNVQAGRAQFGLNWDVQGTNYGRWALGVDGPAQETTPPL